MRTASLLSAPKITSPRITVQIPSVSSPGLRRLYLKHVDQSKKGEADDSIRILESDSNVHEKELAIKELAKLLVQGNYYDEHLVPLLIKYANDQNFRALAIEALAEVVDVISVYDTELMPIFNSAILNIESCAPMKGAKTLFLRGNYFPETVRKAISVVENSKSFLQSLEGLAFLNAYLTVGIQLQSELRLIAALKEERKFDINDHVDDSKNVGQYIENEMLHEFPEIAHLVSIVNGNAYFNIPKLKAQTNLKLSELISSSNNTEQGIVSLVVKSSEHMSENVKLNAIACMGSIATSSAGIDGRILQAAMHSVNDDSLSVICNSLELLQSISERSYYVAIESEDIFIEFARNGRTSEIKAFALLGLTNLMRLKDVEHQKVKSLLLEAANYRGDSDLLKKSAMLANSTFLRTNDLPDEVVNSYLDLTKDANAEVRESAINALFAKSRTGIISGLEKNIAEWINDLDSSVRAASFRLAALLIENNALQPNDLMPKIRLSITSSDYNEQSQALYAFASELKQSKLLVLSDSDVEMLIRLASNTTHDVARAATSCLSQIAIIDSGRLSGFHVQDKIELLCKIYADCLPPLNDQYQGDIVKANRALKKKFADWKREQSEQIETNLVSNRLLLRSDTLETLIDALGTTIKHMNDLLILRAKEIIELRTSVTDLELKLLKEQQIRAKLEEDLTLQVQEILSIKEAPQRNLQTKTKVIVAMWFFERGTKFLLSGGNPAVFLPDVLFRDICAKVAVRCFSAPVIELTSNMDEKSVREVVDLFDDLAGIEI